MWFNIYALNFFSVSIQYGERQQRWVWILKWKREEKYEYSWTMHPSFVSLSLLSLSWESHRRKNANIQNLLKKTAMFPYFLEKYNTILFFLTNKTCVYYMEHVNFFFAFIYMKSIIQHAFLLWFHLVHLIWLTVSSPNTFYHQMKGSELGPFSTNKIFFLLKNDFVQFTNIIFSTRFECAQTNHLECVW